MPVTLSSALDTLGVIRSVTKTNVYVRAGSTGSASTSQKVDYDTETTDTLNEFNTTTATFTANGDGKRMFHAEIEIDDPASDRQHEVYLWKNGTTAISDKFLFDDGAFTGKPVLHITSVLDLDDGDTIAIYVASSANTTIQGSIYTHLSITSV